MYTIVGKVVCWVWRYTENRPRPNAAVTRRLLRTGRSTVEVTRMPYLSSKLVFAIVFRNNWFWEDFVEICCLNRIVSCFFFENRILIGNFESFFSIGLKRGKK